MSKNAINIAIGCDDNATPVLKQAEKSVKDFAKSSDSLDVFGDKLKDVEGPAKSFQQKLRNIQKEMQKMQLDGLDNTDTFVRLANQAGQYKDAVSDSADMVRALSDDHLMLSTATSAMEALAGCANLAASAYTMLGGSEEDAQRATAICTSAISALNGITTVANALNEHSSLIIGIRALQQRALTASVIETTTATEGATIAQKALNLVCEANPYVLLATAIIGVGTALYAYISHTEDAKKADEAHQKAIEDKNKALQDEYHSVGEGMVQYQSYIAKIEQCKKGHGDEQTLLKELQNTYGDTIGFYSDINSYYESMVAHSDAYCKQLVIEAQMRKLANEQADNIAEEYSIRKNADGSTRYYNTKRQTRQEMRTDGEDVWSVDVEIKGTSDLDKAQAKLNANKKRQLEIDKRLKALAVEQAKLQTQVHTGSYTQPKSGSGSSTHSTKTNTKEELKLVEDANTIKDIKNNIDYLTKKQSGLEINSDEYKSVTEQLNLWNEKLELIKDNGFESGSISDYKNQIKELQDQLDNLNLTQEDRFDKTKKIKELEEQIVALTPKENAYAKGSIADYEEQISAIENRLKNENLDAPTRIMLTTSAQALQEQIDVLSGKVKLTIGELKLPDSYTDAIGSRSNSESAISTYQQMWNNGIISQEKYQELANQINDQLKAMGQTPIDLNFKTDAMQKMAEQTQAVNDCLNTLFSTLTNIGDNIGGIFGGIVSSASIVGQILLGFATASSQASSLGPWGWLAFLGAGLSAVALTVQQVKSLGGFAYGGKVSGNSYSGDRLLVRVNSGEQILTKTQSDILTKKLESIGEGGGKQVVELKLRGQELVGLSKNYNDKHSYTKR